MKQDGKYYNLSLLLIVQKQCVLLGKNNQKFLVKHIVDAISGHDDFHGSKKTLYSRIIVSLRHIESAGLIIKEEIRSEKKKIMYQFTLISNV